MPNIIKLAAAIFICEGAGIFGAFFTSPAIQSWYLTLNKPFFNPPNWVFGPVWDTLYFLMGVSLYLIWKTAGQQKIKEEAIRIFLSQLLLNILWSVVFFGAYSLILGLLVIIALWLLILRTIQVFSKLSKLSSQLLYPYLAWVSFASILNLAIVLLNPLVIP